LKTEHSVRALSSCVLIQLLTCTKFSFSRRSILNEMTSDSVFVYTCPDSIHNVINDNAQRQELFLSINPKTLNNGYEN